jgi:hypothetical protein
MPRSYKRMKKTVQVVVVENLAGIWRWQWKVIEKKWQGIRL